MAGSQTLCSKLQSWAATVCWAAYCYWPVPAQPCASAGAGGSPTLRGHLAAEAWADDHHGHLQHKLMSKLIDMLKVQYTRLVALFLYTVCYIACCCLTS